ncbi:MAG: LacI family DNA-binding transcriptional regulator [Victivallaceae bacterium]|nr:LacI family DNA-binding transcriptional regulator [Victivallaceae bacterium]
MRKAVVKVDIEYIAMKLRMSKSTVSKALNDRSDVSVKTKEKVQKFAKKLNYTPDRFARAMRIKKSNLIGVVMHEMRHEFFVEIARGVTRAAQGNGYQAVFASSEGSSRNEADLINDLISRYIDGLIIIPCLGENPSHLKELAAEARPGVIVDNYIDGIDIPFVGTDFKEGGYIATKYLIDKGHKNIALILGRQELSSTPERLAGYSEALNEAGIAVKEQYVKYGTYSATSGQQLATKVLETLPEITAILCANTDLSEGAAKGINSTDRKIPEDISLLDFGGARFTAVNQKNEEIGQTAVQILLQLIKGEKVPEKIIIKPEIINRNSVNIIS